MVYNPYMVRHVHRHEAAEYLRRITMDNKDHVLRKNLSRGNGTNEYSKKLFSEKCSQDRIKPVRFLIFLLPVVLAFFLSFMLKSDQQVFLCWWLILLVFGIGAFPITSWLFSSFLGKGYGFAKA